MVEGLLLILPKSPHVLKVITSIMAAAERVSVFFMCEIGNVGITKQGMSIESLLQ